MNLIDVVTAAVVGEGGVTVTEGLCLARDGTGLVFVEPANPRGTAAWVADPDRPFPELTSVVCQVPDVDREVAFWGPAGLGPDCWYDVTFASAELARMARLPTDCRVRLAFLAGATTARIEVLAVVDAPSGVDRRPDQRPGHSLGHSGWVVQTRDLHTALAPAAQGGIPVTLCEPAG